MRTRFNKILIVIIVLITLGGAYFLVSEANRYSKEEMSLVQKNEQQLQQVEKAQKAKEEEIKKKQEEQKKIEEKKLALDEKCSQAEKLFNSGNYKGAIQAAEEVLKEDNQNCRALTIKGVSLCYTRKTSGLDEIEKAISIKPDYGYALYYKALAYEKFWRYDDALNYYEKALKGDSENDIKALSNYGIAVIAARKGDMDKASKYLKEAVQLDENLKNRAANEPLLSKIKVS